MPPKKVVAPPPPTDPSEMSPALQQQLANTEGMSEFELPKTTLAKLAKGSVPGYVKMQQEVGMALNRGSTLFINYLTAAAHDQAHARSGRQITAADVLKAIAELDFGPADNLIPQLEIELAAFRARQEAIKASKAKPAGPGRGRKRKSEAGGEGDDVEMAEDDEEEEAEGVDGAEDEDETEDPAPTTAGDSRIPDDQDDGAS